MRAGCVYLGGEKKSDTEPPSRAEEPFNGRKKEELQLHRGGKKLVREERKEPRTPPGKKRNTSKHKEKGKKKGAHRQLEKRRLKKREEERERSPRRSRKSDKWESLSKKKREEERDPNRGGKHKKQGPQHFSILGAEKRLLDFWKGTCLKQ